MTEWDVSFSVIAMRFPPSPPAASPEGRALWCSGLGNLPPSLPGAPHTKASRPLDPPKFVVLRVWGGRENEWCSEGPAPRGTGVVLGGRSGTI